jgi:hypothetical protein
MRTIQSNHVNHRHDRVNAFGKWLWNGTLPEGDFAARLPPNSWNSLDPSLTKGKSGDRLFPLDRKMQIKPLTF